MNPFKARIPYAYPYVSNQFCRRYDFFVSAYDIPTKQIQTREINVLQYLLDVATYDMDDNLKNRLFSLNHETLDKHILTNTIFEHRVDAWILQMHDCHLLVPNQSDIIGDSNSKLQILSNVLDKNKNNITAVYTNIIVDEEQADLINTTGSDEIQRVFVYFWLQKDRLNVDWKLYLEPESVCAFIAEMKQNLCALWNRHCTNPKCMNYCNCYHPDMLSDIADVKMFC
jgi:hypothetical protein